MYDEDGRKIDMGYRLGMALEGMSVAELEAYISKLRLEIERVETEKNKQQAHAKAAEKLFK